MNESKTIYVRFPPSSTQIDPVGDTSKEKKGSRRQHSLTPAIGDKKSSRTNQHKKSIEYWVTKNRFTKNTFHLTSWTIQYSEMTPSVSFIFMSLECTRRIFGNGILAQRFLRESRNLGERSFLRGVISLELLLKPMRLGGGKATLALWKTFLWKSLTGLQKCYQESYVAKSCSYFEEGGAASTQFPKQKSWRGKRRTDFSTSGFWRISLSLYWCWRLSPWTNCPSLFSPNFPILHNSTRWAQRIRVVKKRQKLS